MSEIIKYDFNLSKKSTENLKDVADFIDRCIIKKSEDSISLLADAWQSDAADKFSKKFMDLLSEYKNIQSEIICSSEELKKLSYCMYLKEKESIEIVKNNSGE